MAQILARHSDIRLTLGVYTHLELHDQTLAIRMLQAPPVSGNGKATEKDECSLMRQMKAWQREKWCPVWCPVVPSLVPNTSHLSELLAAPVCTETGAIPRRTAIR